MFVSTNEILLVDLLKNRFEKPSLLIINGLLKTEILINFPDSTKANQESFFHFLCIVFHKEICYALGYQR